MNYRIKTYKINRIDLEKINTTYNYDIAQISDEQWLKLATAITIQQETGLKEQIYAIQTAILKVKFSESKTDNSAVANVNIQYARENNELVEVTKKFDVDGMIGEENELIEDLWSEIVFSALNYANKNKYDVVCKFPQE